MSPCSNYSISRSHGGKRRDDRRRSGGKTAVLIEKGGRDWHWQTRRCSDCYTSLVLVLVGDVLSSRMGDILLLVGVEWRVLRDETIQEVGRWLR